MFDAFTTFTFLKKTQSSLCGKTNLKQRFGGCLPLERCNQHPTHVASTAPPHLLLPSPSRVPRSRETQDFRFAGNPPSEFSSTFTRIPARWDQGCTGVPRVTRGRVGPLRRAPRELAGSRVAASLAERGATAGLPRRPGQAAEVHSARPATLKPVPQTAPWRR